MCCRWTSCLVSIAALFGVTGCIPMVLPAPSEKDPVPYTETDLSFIRPGEATRDELIDRLGQPMLQRRAGQLAIYGKIQKTGTQAVWFLFPVPVPVGLDARELAHHLVIQFDSNGVVTHFEVIRAESCTSDAICVESTTERLEQEYMSLETGSKILAADHAIVYDMGAAANAARASVARDSECLLFVVVNKKGFAEDDPAYFRLDRGSPSPIGPRVFALFQIARGTHAISSGKHDNPDRHTVSFECSGGTRMLAEITKEGPALRPGPDSDANLLAGLGLLLTD